MFPFDIKNLGASFRRYFEIVPALTEELRGAAYRIRHQVYCEELGFERANAARMETDAYDAHSLHCLIRSVITGQFVGCTRIIRCNPAAPDALFPFEKVCGSKLERSVVDPARLPRHRMAEVSRLAVISSFRVRRHEHRSPFPLTDESFGGVAQPRFPYIPVALYLASTELAAVHGIDKMFVLTEPRLASHFARLGVNVQQIGAPVEHRGTRVPSMLDVKEILRGLNFIMRPLYEVVADEVHRGIEQQQAVI